MFVHQYSLGPQDAMTNTTHSKERNQQQSLRVPCLYMCQCCCTDTISQEAFVDFPCRLHESRSILQISRMKAGPLEKRRIFIPGLLHEIPPTRHKHTSVFLNLVTRIKIYDTEREMLQSSQRQSRK